MYNTLTTLRTTQPLTREVVTTLSTPQEFLEIFEDIHSGHVATREKTQTLNDVLHPCVIIGRDKYGRLWVAHNHKDHGKPVFETIKSYAKGEKVFFDNAPVNYSRSEIVMRAINEVMKGKTYLYVDYNCQVFVNIIVRNDHYSESIDVISDRVMVIGFGAVLLGLVTKSKTITAIGATVIGIGGAAKVSNRYKKLV